MPTTIEQIARQAKAELDSDCNLELVGQWATQKVSELYAKTRYKALRKYGELIIPQAITAGTVTVQVGLKTVAGDATAGAAWSVAQEGWFFRVFPAKTWYRVARVDTNMLVLEDQFVSENASTFIPGTPVAGQSYFLVPRFVAAANDARFFGIFVLDRMYQPLEWFSPEEMQARYPSRYLVGPYPWCVSEAQQQLGATGWPKLLEFYPAPTITELVHYTYWTHPPTIGFTENLPSTLDSYIIKELCMVPILRYEMMKAARMGRIDAAGFYRNEMRTQESKGYALIDEAIRNDAGVDDGTFIMQRKSWRRHPPDFDAIQTAREDVWSREG